MSHAVVAKVVTKQVRGDLGLLDCIDSSVQGIEALRRITEQKAALAAAEAEVVAELEAIRDAEDTARGVAKARRCGGLGAEIGLAIGESPNRGTRLLNTSRALVREMPNTMQALASGEINQERAQVVVTETNWLSTEHRSKVDALMAGNFAGHGPQKLGGKVRAHAQKLDQAGAVKRNEKAVTERRVSVRPAAHGMAYLTALLPTQQAIAMLVALKKDATTAPGDSQAEADSSDSETTGQQPRTPDQIMADTLVERTTGQTTAEAVGVEVQLVMTDSALLGDSDQTPANLVGHGPLPAALARRMIGQPDAKVFVRRLFTRPKDHQLINLESRARLFPEGLRRMILLREGICRTPYCDAPIREYDHAQPYRDGGPTSWANSSGLCAACNKIKEHTGWTHQASPEQLTVTTPTGHTYTNTTDPILDGLPPDKQAGSRDEYAEPWDESVDPPDGEGKPPQLRNDTNNYTRRNSTMTTVRLAS